MEENKEYWNRQKKVNEYVKMREDVNYELFHQKYMITVSCVQKMKLQVVLVWACYTKFRIEYKEKYFSHTTFWTMHSDMPFFRKNGH